MEGSRREDRPPTRRDRERAAHREEILSAAERVFSARGYDGASMAQIAAAADYSVGSLYNFFRDKASLGEEVMVRICEERAAELEALAARRPSASATLRELAAGFARHIAEHGPFLRMSLSLQTSRGHETPPPRIAALLDRQRAALASLFSRPGAFVALPPADLAAAASALCFHFAYEWRPAGGAADPVRGRAFADRLGDLLETLLLARKG